MLYKALVGLLCKRENFVFGGFNIGCPLVWLPEHGNAKSPAAQCAAGLFGAEEAGLEPAVA